MKVWRLYAGVETWRFGGIEIWGLDVGVATWRLGGLEHWTSGGMPEAETWGYRGSARWRYGALEVSYRYRAPELYSSEATLEI